MASTNQNTGSKVFVTNKEPNFHADSIRSQCYDLIRKAGARGTSLDTLADKIDGASAAVSYLAKQKYVKVGSAPKAKAKAKQQPAA